MSIGTKYGLRQWVKTFLTLEDAFLQQLVRSVTDAACFV